MSFSFFARPVVAIAFGAFIICAEACRHFEGIVRPESWLDVPWHDWAAGAMLVHAGIIRRTNHLRAHAYLAAAWGFMTSLLAGAVVAHAEELSVPSSPDEWITAPVFLSILVGLLLVSASALISTIREHRDST